jgi:hypothetical protein
MKRFSLSFHEKDTDVYELLTDCSDALRITRSQFCIEAIKHYTTGLETFGIITPDRKKIERPEIKSDLAEFIDVVCDVCAISMDDLCAGTRFRHFVDARRMIFYFAKSSGYRTYEHICDSLSLLGLPRYDHATVIYGCKSHKNLYLTDKRYSGLYDEVCLRYFGDELDVPTE